MMATINHTLRASFKWLLLAAVCLGSLKPAPASEATSPIAWPPIVWPAGVRHFSVANTLVVQGVPLHIRGFTSNRSPRDLIADFQKSYASQLVETPQPSGSILLGKPEGDHFFLNFSVKPSSDGAGSQGEATLTPLKLPSDHMRRYQQDQAWWRRQLPSAYQLMQHQVSIDPHQQALYLILQARASASHVHSALVRVLAAQGFRVEEKGPIDQQPSGPVYFVPDETSRSNYQSLPGHPSNAAMLIRSERAGTHSAVVSLVFADDETP